MYSGRWVASKIILIKIKKADNLRRLLFNPAKNN
jgi:hypothetical protein